MDTTPRLASLADIEAAVWRELDAAVHRRGHAWRVGVLATVNGDEADARSVVLRDLDAAARTLLIYTDARSCQPSALLHSTSVPRGLAASWRVLPLRASV